MPQAIAIAKKDKRIPMFIWFVFRDSSVEPVAERHLPDDGAAKPAAPKWNSAAKPVDRVNGKVSVKGGTVNPSVVVYLREFCANNPVGARVGAWSQTFRGSTRVQNAQSSHTLAVDCTITVRLVGLTGGQGPDLQGADRREHGHDAPLRRTITIVGT